MPDRENAGDLDDPARADRIVQLMEEGHGEELRDLTSRQTEDELASCFRLRSGRQLSRRSRAFWSVVLDEVPPAIRGIQDDLWPL